MFHLQSFLYEYPLLSVAQTAFTVWMLVDAYRRGTETWWFWIILIFQPIGPWVYFFAEKWRHLEWKLPGGWFERKTSLDELQFRARQSPTLANHLALAERLVELERFEEAIAPLEEARRREPDHAPICFRLARCLHELGRSTEAEPLLAVILQKEPRWEDYAAWRLLLKVQEVVKKDDTVLDTARQLVKLSPRMEHKVLLAQQLARLHQDGEARLVLENALQEQQFVTGPVRRLNRTWVKEAKRLLRELAPI